MGRNLISLILSGLLIISGFSLRVLAEENFPLVHINESIGVIFPEEYVSDLYKDFRYLEAEFGIKVDRFWTPTLPDIEKAEVCIRKTLEIAQTDPDTIDEDSQKFPLRKKYLQEEITKILSSFASYRRQYIGIIVQGEKRIFCNYFPSARDEKNDSFSNWKKALIAVEDGGYWFWRIQYDVEKDKCLKFDSNGYA